MCNRSTSPIRTVIAIADRMPESAAVLPERPAVGIAKLARYLKQVDAGVLRSRIAMCGRTVPRVVPSVTFKPVLFNFSPPPAGRIDSRGGIAVRRS
jgi:hypothetical protein